jgi:hypothetical protein
MAQHVRGAAGGSGPQGGGQTGGDGQGQGGKEDVIDAEFEVKK